MKLNKENTENPTQAQDYAELLTTVFPLHHYDDNTPIVTVMIHCSSDVLT